MILFRNACKTDLFQIARLEQDIFSNAWTENAIEETLSWATVVGIGPGLGNSQKAQEVLKNIFQYWNCKGNCFTRTCLCLGCNVNAF